MTLAGYDLQSSDIKIIDLSYRYGYDSPTSFTRAFQQFHGVSPKESRAAGAKLRVFPKMQIACEEQYAWEIRRMPELRMVGKSITIIRDDEHNVTKIPGFLEYMPKRRQFFNNDRHGSGKSQRAVRSL